MFRSQQNGFDDAVVKATDENLTSENWAFILDVCDRVSTSPQGPSSVIAALIKRLAHRNANVQLYSLELANALSQNCGPPLHRELASRSFTEALLRLANDRNTHQQVKSKILECMAEWSEMFRGDADLGIMEGAYDRLRAGNPGLAPPSKPVKRQIEDGDRRKEDEELQMALALSLRDKAASPAKDSQPAGSSAQQDSSQAAAPAGTTAATVSRVKALYDFTPSEAGELAFRKGDIIAVLESVYKDWWKGSLRGQTGIFPLNYVEKLQDPTRAELEHDAVMEGEVFSQIRNVEKLLALLSVRGEGGMGGARDQGSEEEITELYHQTLAIRPKLIELIGKYSQKKDDFTQLNEKFIKARRDYEALLESSMAQPQYGHPRQSSQNYYNAYAPQQGYPPQQSQQPNYPPQGPPQDHQRFYNQPPSESQHQNGYGYPPSNHAATATPISAPAPAPFHFIPGGAPPAEARQTPKPLAPSMPLSDNTVPPAYPPQQQQNFDPRPNSIYTLNSGNPQELSTNAYESPTDNRNSQYAPNLNSSQTLPPQQQPPPQQQQQQQQQSYPYPPSVAAPDHSYSPGPTQQLPIRQRTVSFESPSSAYSPQVQQQRTQDGPYPAYGEQPSQPGHAPPGPPPAQQQAQHTGGGYPSLGGNAAPPAGGYQAYNPNVSSQQAWAAQSQQTGGTDGGDDASDFYR